VNPDWHKATEEMLPLDYAVENWLVENMPRVN